MFFENEDVSLKAIGAYKFIFEKNKEKVVPKDYYRLSLRTKLQGKTIISAGNEVFLPGKSDILFIPPGMSYERKSENEELIAFHFYADNLYDKNIEIVKNVSPKIEDLFKRAYKTDLYQHEKGTLKLNSILYSIFFELNELPYRPEIKAAIAIIKKNYCSSNFFIGDISKELHVSESHLRKIFKTETGMSLKKYCDTMRFERATSLLKSDYISVEDVAELVGFTNTKNFSTAFKKKYNMSPSQYQKEYI